MPDAAISSIPDGFAQAMKSTSVWQPACPVPLHRLNLITVPYVDFADKDHDDGKLVALDVVCQALAKVFTQLYQLRFPIDKMRLIHDYSGDDALSMADNNTSCFCFRPVLGTSTISVHSYGVALDINPLQNPYLTIEQDRGLITSHPHAGWKYINRHNQVPGMVEPIVGLLAENGFFEWGGKWTAPVDYQHFQPPRGLAELLVSMPADDGKQLLSMAILHRSKLTSMPHGDKLTPVHDLYRNNKSEFFDKWIELTRAI